MTCTFLAPSLTDGQGKLFAIGIAIYLDWPPNTAAQAWADLSKLRGEVVTRSGASWQSFATPSGHDVFDENAPSANRIARRIVR